MATRAAGCDFHEVPPYTAAGTNPDAIGGAKVELFRPVLSTADCALRLKHLPLHQRRTCARHPVRCTPLRRSFATNAKSVPCFTRARRPLRFKRESKIQPTGLFPKPVSGKPQFPGGTVVALSESACGRVALAWPVKTPPQNEDFAASRRARHTSGDPRAA